MTKENPSKKERIGAARGKFSRKVERINRNRKEAKNKESLPSSLSWLFKKKKNGNG